MKRISLADSAGPLLFLFFLLLLVLLVASIIKRVQGRSASKQSGRQEIVSIKAVSLSLYLKN